MPVAAFTHGGRFAIYDPRLLGAAGLAAVGAPDANVITGTRWNGLVFFGLKNQRART